MRMLAGLLALILATPAVAQVSYPPSKPVDTSTLATKAEVQAAQTAATNATTAATGAIKSINGSTPNGSGAVTVAIPTAATSMPPGVGDSGSAGTMTTVYALANHTHASKARKCIFTSAADGTFNWTFTVGGGTCPASTAFNSPPICVAVAETAAGVTDVINVQLVGSPTTTGAIFLVNRTQRSVAAVLGITVLSVPSQPGATKVHAICLEP